jgi:glycosyltransferase involved in cell wall biosynthesis
VKNKGYGLYIMELSKSLGIQNNIKYCGFLDEYQMSKLFSKSHIFVNPSFIENESLAMLEALSVGTPTIVTYTGGMPDNTSSSWIEYFPVGESAVLANKIETLFKKSNFEIKKISNDAKNAIRKKVDKELIVSKTIQMYKEVLELYKT